MILYKQINIDLERARKRITYKNLNEKFIYTKKERKAMGEILDLFELGQFEQILQKYHGLGYFSFFDDDICGTLQDLAYGDKYFLPNDTRRDPLAKP